MSTTLTPRPEINASAADAQRDGPNMLDHFDQPTKDPCTNIRSKERTRSFQMLAADAAARSAFDMLDEQPMSKIASYMASSSTEQHLNEGAQLNVKPRLRYRPSFPSIRINEMLPLIDFKEKPNDGATNVGGATIVPQNQRHHATMGQTDACRERVEMPAALSGGVIGSRDNSAKSINQAGAHDMHQAQPIQNHRAPSRTSLPEPTNLSSEIPSYIDLAREMQVKRDAFRSGQEKTNGLFYEKLSQQKDDRFDLPITSDLGPDMHAHREAFRSTRGKTSGLFYENLLQPKDNLDVASKPSSHHSSELAAKEPARQSLPQTPILRPTREQRRVASATISEHQHLTQEADGESQLGKMSPLLSSATYVQPTSDATLLDHQARLYQLDYQNQLRKLRPQPALHGFGGLHHGLNSPSNSLSDDELDMIHPFMRKLATSNPSAEPPNPQEELTMPHELHVAQKGPRKIVVTEDKRESQDAMVGDLHKQDSQARGTKNSSPLLSLSGGLQDIGAAWSEPEVANTSPVDSHCSQKKAPVDGSYLAEEERKVLDHVRGSMSTNLPVTKVQDRSSTNTGGNLEPARRSVSANTFMEDLQTLDDPNLGGNMTSRVGPLDVDLLQGLIPEASTPFMAQAHKATQTYPGQKTDPYKELDAIMQRQSVKARSWNTTNTEASRRAEESAKFCHARFFGEPSQTRSSTSTGKMSVPSAAVDTIASRIPVRESTIMPPLYECLPCRPKSEKANVSFSRPTRSAPATYSGLVYSKTQSSGAQTAPSVSIGQHSNVINHDTRTIKGQMKPAQEILNELHVAPNGGDQRGQVTGKSSELLGMLKDVGNGISSQAINDTPITGDHAELMAKPVVSNKLLLSEEKREQMIKEGPRSLRDFQRAMGCIDSGKNPQAPGHPPHLTGNTNLKLVEEEPAASKNLRSATEKGDRYDKRHLKEAMRTLCLDTKEQSQRRSEPENGNSRLEPAAKRTGPTSNLYLVHHMEESQEDGLPPHSCYVFDESKPHAMNKPRAAKAEIYKPEKDATLSKPSYTMESEGQRMWDRDYALGEALCEGSLRRIGYTSAKINPPTTESISSATKTQSWIEPRAVKREKLMREFWSQPKNMTTYKGPDCLGCDSKSRSGSSPMSARDAVCNLPSPPSTPEIDLRSVIGGPDIDNWRMLVDLEFKDPSAAAHSAAKGQLTFSKEPILSIPGSAPAENEDPVATSLPVFTREVAYHPPATEKVTTPSATPQTIFSSRNSISVSITGDADARSADASTDVFVARDENEDNGKGDQNDWTVLDSDYSSSSDSLVDSNEVLEAAPSEASDPSSTDVEVGDDQSEMSEDEWIIC